MADKVAVNKAKSDEKELSGTNLSGADIRQAIFHCQFIREANLSGVIYDDTTKWEGCASASWYIQE